MSLYQDLKTLALDISNEFQSMNKLEFDDFVNSKAEEAVLQIIYNLNFSQQNFDNLKRLKIFLDKSAITGQKRFVIIRYDTNNESTSCLEEFKTAGFILEPKQ